MLKLWDNGKLVFFTPCGKFWHHIVLFCAIFGQICARFRWSRRWHSIFLDIFQPNILDFSLTFKIIANIYRKYFLTCVNIYNGKTWCPTWMQMSGANSWTNRKLNDSNFFLWFDKKLFKFEINDNKFNKFTSLIEVFIIYSW